ncbi:preprotein translocase subunit SecG [candidate division WS6 bacterium RIFOXYC1_FULL_33_10]|uniref:Protein-export membrane protein SecG n=2 Tax=Candidatus Dojkabacteria TaxID=74243 RepID=A0A1F4UJ95_9BACT|nr:MAG: preprotein translocase subunit SecG [candidate division WS6 bacterium RIFOXYB1_FULL_33_14]OGC46762.1 MAG: preprotein translocase subunit SecG [candidate division WS6 bacterium RIFOXYC1_FULL_33_10]
MNPNLQNILLYVQIAVCILVVISVLLQNRAEGLGKMFGGGGEVFRTKRGLEKFLYYFTIFLAVLLVAISLLLYKYS